jgi:acyl-coenzyme A synthetase/AMP-(fatty) acid ligase
LEPGPGLEKELITYCQAHLIKWSCPREVIFQSNLPLTLLGKVDYRKVQREESERRAAPGVRMTAQLGMSSGERKDE